VTYWLSIDKHLPFTHPGRYRSIRTVAYPSAVGYQANAGRKEMASEDVLTSTKPGSIRRFQAVYVPPRKLPTPRQPPTFAHLDANRGTVS